MRSLADETGLSPMAAYKHFENQRALQVELWRVVHDHFYDQLLDASAGAPDPGTACMNVAETFLRYAIEWPYRYEVLFNHPIVRETQEIQEIAEQRLAVVSYAQELVARAQNAGIFRDDQPADALLVAVTAQVRGLAGMLIYTQPARLEHFSVDELVANSMQFCREALMPR